MTDIRADDATPLDEEDRLPWLEAVDEDDESDGPSPLKLVVAVLIGLAAIGLVISSLFWWGNRSASNGAPEVIAAQSGDYKVKPDTPGGMKVEGSGETSFAASEGAIPKGTINVNAVPEEPVAKAPAQPAPAPAAQKAAPTAAPVANTPAVAPAAPAGPGSTIQLGAFSSGAAANSAWKSLAARFKYLEPLTHSVTPVTAGGKTLYRLRASGPNAGNLCGRLKVAGESCVSL